MGLDIYLNWFKDFEEAKRLEREYEKLSKESWEGNDVDEKYEKLSEEEIKEYREKESKIAESLGLDNWGTYSDPKGTKRIEKDHPKYPDHYFKIGYFRSSYNGSGIERILRNLGLGTLHWIFQRDSFEEAYEFRPDWEIALERVKKVKEDLESMDDIRCYSVGENIFGAPEDPIDSEEKAIKAFLEEKDKMIKSLSSGQDPFNYSNSIGEFRMAKPESLLAMIPGKDKILGEKSCVYMIVESDNDWYIEALEIVEDTIKFVLDQKDKEKYCLSWSG